MTGQRGGRQMPQAPVIDYKRAEVKLNKAENAWKPGAVKQVEKAGEEENAHQDLLRRFRGILNKITPQKFENLVEKVRPASSCMPSRRARM